MVVHTCNPNTQEVEAGEVQGLPEVTSDPAPSSKKKRKKEKSSLVVHFFVVVSPAFDD